VATTRQADLVIDLLNGGWAKRYTMQPGPAQFAARLSLSICFNTLSVRKSFSSVWVHLVSVLC